MKSLRHVLNNHDGQFSIRTPEEIYIDTWTHMHNANEAIVRIDTPILNFQNAIDALFLSAELTGAEGSMQWIANENQLHFSASYVVPIMRFEFRVSIDSYTMGDFVQLCDSACGFAFDNNDTVGINSYRNSILSSVKLLEK